MSVEIPEGWARCKIGEVTQIVSGGTPPSKDLTNFTTEDGISWITPADLSGYKDIYISRGRRNLSDKGFSACSATKIPSGSVLFSSRAPVGYVAIAANELTTNQGFKSFVLPEGLDSRFVYFYLKYIKPVAESMATGTTFKELSSSVAAQLPLALAPLKEQKLIADKLDRLLVRVDACHDRLERVSCILKDFRQAVIADATSGKLTENWRAEHRNVDFNREIGDELTEFCFADARCFGNFRFPVSWNVARLGEIAEIVGGITKDSKKQDPAYEELPYLRVANVQRGFFDLREIKTIRVPQQRIEELLLTRGDILFNEGGDIDKLGRGWVWDSEIERCTFQNHVFRVRLKNKFFEPKFFSWYGNSRGAAYFLSVGKQTTNLASINKSLLSALPIVIPPVEEQSEIVRRVEVLFGYADRIDACYQNALTRVEQLTPILLSKAFRGELVPQDPDDEPASVLLERIKSEKRGMDSKRKTTRTVRSKTKEKSTNFMPKSLDDCVKALRSAFQKLGGQTDADKLFDQAGFQAEEVVQFYEALRLTPEVRVAFEKSTQEYSVETQSSIAKGGNDHSSQKGSFRLIELWLEDFKNLTDYTVRFDSSHSIDIVLGWNGTGKSNLFEALVIIFRDLYKWWEKNQWTENPMKGYRLRYVVNEKIIEISWQPGAMKRPKLKMGTLQAEKDEPEQLKSIARHKLLLPRFIFGYYSDLQIA